MKKIFQLINKNLFSVTISYLFDRKKPKKITKKLPLITISREKGSGGRPIAYLVAKKLGNNWRVYHKEIVDEIVKETHLKKEIVEEIDEKKLPLIEQLIDDVFGRRYPNLSSYHKNLIKILSIHRGYAIIVGRGADYLFPYALKVRIICQMEQRIAWLMEFEKISKQEAKRRIRESDIKRVEFIKSLYHHDPRKAHHYDLVIQTGPCLSIEDAADLIAQAAKKRFHL